MLSRSSASTCWQQRRLFAALSDDKIDVILTSIVMIGRVDQPEPKTIAWIFFWLSSFDFIEAKVHHPQYGLQSLLADYDFVFSTPTLVEGLKNRVDAYETLQAIAQALRISASLVQQDAALLRCQLYGRLLETAHTTPTIQLFLTHIAQRPIAWLRPLTPALFQSGASILSVQMENPLFLHQTIIR